MWFYARDVGHVCIGDTWEAISRNHYSTFEVQKCSWKVLMDEKNDFQNHAISAGQNHRVDAYMLATHTEKEMTSFDALVVELVAFEILKNVCIWGCIFLLRAYLGHR